MSAKRHCMVVHAHYPLGESRVERQARALIRKGFEVDVICLRDDERAVETIHGINIYRLPVRRHKRSGLVVQLFEYLFFLVCAFFSLVYLNIRRRYSVIQVHNLPDFLIFSAIVPKLSGARLILDLHDLMPEFFAASYNRAMDSLPVRMLLLQEKISCGFADHVITVTETWRKTLIARGIPEDKVSVVMNVADSQVFQPLSAYHRAHGENGSFNLIYHGTLAKRYGLDLLLHAIDMVRSEIPTVHLTIHGLGEYYQELTNLVQELNLAKHVSFSTQLLSIDQLPGLIRDADVGVVPYRSDLFTDGILPTKLMEYIALNMPVIAARTPAIAAYFDDSMVQFFTPGDTRDLATSILSLYKDRSRLAELAQSGKKFINSYSWAQLSEEYVALVEELSAGKI